MTRDGALQGHPCPETTDPESGTAMNSAGTSDLPELITIGRSSIDLYSQDLGKALPEVRRLGAYLGGSPLNIAVGASRLGVRAALVSAVGEDQVGDFILAGLAREGVQTRFVTRKPGARTSAVLLAILPPDRFPITFYRDNAADVQIGIDDLNAVSIERARALVVNGTALALDPLRSAIFLACERARSAGVTVYLDLDFRANQWHDVRAFGVNVRALLSSVDVVIGTEEEINAALLTDPADITITHGQVTAPAIRGDLERNTQALLARAPVVVVKEGARGCTVHRRGQTPLSVPGFPVEVVSVLGAGDAFAAGLVTGQLRGLSWAESARLGNACGAIVVTRIGCADFTPTQAEVDAFMSAQAGQA
ncbi:5-dehydro-2-deoxygluconokinase [Deinococcus peraridilitoris]|uniref:Sugar kinase, ribokinase n=1 Tax=Deinococcus peraridilitoris (strain DSM 19664 / LMG 22246 / CIP 109416 / KR-200) TaxID=937777 RepID=L0A0Z6_DEIPD|nr:5-dehydro-2-deoxygluconokinase [Deinococcus peraridilitoris]AFZ66857.1 sugar kinase, ribokinase [Deinococcus peraridilitoris DSM 19664]